MSFEWGGKKRSCQARLLNTVARQRYNTHAEACGGGGDGGHGVMYTEKKRESVTNTHDIARDESSVRKHVVFTVSAQRPLLYIWPSTDQLL